MISAGFPHFIFLSGWRMVMIQFLEPTEVVSGSVLTWPHAHSPAADVKAE